MPYIAGLPGTSRWPTTRIHSRSCRVFIICELTATPRIRPETSSITTSGPWALLRLMERGRVTDSATTGRAAVEFQFDGRRAVLDLNTGRLASPLTTDLLRSFKCPGSSA